MNHSHTYHRHRHHRRKKLWIRWLIALIVAFILVDIAIVYKMYTDANRQITSAYKSAPHNNLRSNGVDFSKGQPFSVLLLGADTGDYGRTYQGRSDSIMVAGVSKSKTTLVSVPRDTLVQIPGHPGNSKINAAYAYGGVTGSINTLQNYLDVPVDKYIELNLRGLKQLSHIIGPVTVNNDLKYTYLNKTFNKGKISIDENNVLAYTGMRKEDPRGDYGRQLRQRKVLTAMVKKIASVRSIMKYRSILEVMSANMKTDLTFNELKQIFANYKDATHIKQLQLRGKGQMIHQLSYEVVSTQEKTRVQNQLKKTLKLPVQNSK